MDIIDNYQDNLCFSSMKMHFNSIKIKEIKKKKSKENYVAYVVFSKQVIDV